MLCGVFRAKMLRRLLQLPSPSAAAAAAAASVLLAPEKTLASITIGGSSLHPDHHFQLSFRRHFIDLHKIVNKDAIEKEKARLKDELSRGYFADISEIRKNSGKIAPANKTLIPLMASVKFPEMEVHFSDGSSLRLPLSDENVTRNNAEIIPSVSLFCLSFRASSQMMAESWSTPFLHAFSATTDVQVYEVSFIDSWVLSMRPMKTIFLKVAKTCSNPQRRVVYSFGDHYDLRKKLQILNLLTGYIFLLDRHGKIRWQGFGSATSEEVASLVSCACQLLKE